MKIKLPFVGEVKTGADATPEVVMVKAKREKKDKSMDAILGGFFDSRINKLSTDKTVSTKLLQANKDWVYINNDVIAKEVSKMEFKLYSVGLKDGEITYIEIDEHPLLDLLDKFNSTTTTSDALYMTQSHKKLTGDAFWLLKRKGGVITAIFPLTPDQVELDLADPTDASDDLIKGYKYKINVDGKVKEIYYKREEVLHFKTPNPNNMFRGYGAVEAAADTIDLDSYTTEIQKKFYENGAVTNFVLTTENKLQDDQLKRIKAEMKAAYGGVKNAWNTMILGGGLKPEDISYSNKDMMVIDLMEWYRDKIMAIFGNTKSSLGILEDVNRSTNESAIIEWKRNTVEPEMLAIVNTLNEFLVPMFGERLVLGYEELIEEDLSGDIEEAVKLKNGGIISINEAREILDLDPIPGGDEMMTVQDVKDNMKNTNDKPPEKIYRRVKKNLPKPLQKVKMDRFVRKSKILEDQKIYKQIKEEAKPIIKKMLKKKEVQMHPHFSNEKVNAYYEKQINIVNTMEHQFEDAVKKFIGKIEKVVLGRLEAEVSAKKKDLFDESDLLVEAQLDFTPLLLQEAALAGKEALDIIGKDDVYIPFRLEPTIRENVEKFTKSMLDTDRDTLIKLIEDGITQGQSVPEIRSQIESKFNDITRTQSERITRTEVLKTSNMASEDAWIQSGVVEAKQWLTFGAVDECAKYEGKIQKLGGNFYPIENEFDNGDPPLHPNCRCVLLPVVVGAKAYQSIVDKQKYEDRIAELESKLNETLQNMDKRTKAYKQLKEVHREKTQDDAAYIKSLEKYLEVSDEQAE